MADNNEIIPINPQILVWARESIGMTVDDVASRMNKEASVVEQWETGKILPSLAQLENLAYKVYKRPLAVFFMAAPPKEKGIKQDFRTINSQTLSEISPALMLFIRKAKYHQLSLDELYGGSNPANKPLFKHFSLIAGRKSTNYVESIRVAVGYDIAKQISLAKPEDAFNYLREQIANSGIYTFQYPLKDVRGFCLYDDEFPVIVVNSGDSANAKIFTIIHEMAHLLLKEGNMFKEFLNGVGSHEVFCNWFASEFLLPQKVIENEAVKQQTIVSEESIAYLSKKYKVSKEVVLRRFVDMQMASKAYYRHMKEIWDEEYASQSKKPKKDGGPTYYVTHISHLGKPFVRAVLSSFNAGKIDNTQVASYLNIKLNHIQKFNSIVYN